MGLIAARAKRLETAVSVGLLVVIFLIGVGVFLKQFYYDSGIFDVNSAIMGSAPQKIVNEEGIDLSSLTPAGFGMPWEAESYNSENLYEKINGKAPLYTESGFEKLTTGRFVNKDNEKLGMELYVYDMAAAKNAFSVYSVQVRADGQKLANMQFGYRTSNSLYFTCGRYYIELVGWSESEELFNAMMEVADKLQSNLAGSKDIEIIELGLFPRENLVAGGLKLYLADAFGFADFTDTFTARYKFGEESIVAFLSRRSSAEEAKILAEKYYKFLLDNGGVDKTAANGTSEVIFFKMVDMFGSVEILFATGPFVAGVHEAEEQELAESLAAKLIERLRREKNE